MTKLVKIATLLAGVIITISIFNFRGTDTPEKTISTTVNPTAMDKTSEEEITAKPVKLIENTEEQGQTENISALEVENPKSMDTVSDSELSDTALLTDFQMMNPESAGISPDQTGQEFVTTVNPVDWQSARQHERLPQNLLSNEQSTFVAASKVPVLLPNNAALLNDAIVSVGGDWYAASMNSDEVNVLIDGSSIAVALPDSEPKQNIGLDNFSDNIVKSLGMVEVSFSAYGVNYNVVVECYSHETNPACLETDFINSIVSNLLLAEGDNNEDGA